MKYRDPDTGSVWDSDTGVSYRPEVQTQQERTQQLESLPEAAGSLGSMAAGVGRTAGRLQAGVQDLWNTATFDRPAKERLRARESEAERNFRARTREAPVSAFVGESLPYSLLPPGSTPARAALLGAGAGAATYNPDPTVRALGVLGGAGGNVVGRSLGPQGAGLLNRSPASKTADQLGFQLTPGQRLGSPTLQLGEAAARSLPIVGQPLNRIQGINARRMTNLAAEGIGTRGRLTPERLGAAKDRIGAEFDRLTATDVRADDALLDDLASIRADYGETVFSEQALEADVNRVLSRIQADDVIPGSAYQNSVSKIRRKAESLLTSNQGDREQGLALMEIKEALDNAASRSMSPKQAADFRTARSQWRNLMLLTGTGREVVTPDGDLRPLQLAQVLRQKDKTGFVFGKNETDLYKLARLSQQTRDLVPDSGTATRQSMRDLFFGGAGAGAVIDPVNTGSALLGGNLLTRGYVGLPNMLGTFPKAAGVPGGILAGEEMP